MEVRVRGRNTSVDERLREMASRRDRLASTERLRSIALESPDGEFRAELERLVTLERKSAQEILRPWRLGEAIRDPSRFEVSEQWLFDGVLARQGGGLIHLDSGEGKTWIGIEIALSKVTCTGGSPLMFVWKMSQFPARFDANAIREESGAKTGITSSAGSVVIWRIVRPAVDFM